MGEERGEFEARFTKQKTSGQILGTVERRQRFIHRTFSYRHNLYM